MHDIKFIEANLEEFNKSMKLRKFSENHINNTIATNKKRKKLTGSVEKTQSEIKKISKEVGMKKKNGESADELMFKVAELKKLMASDNELLVQAQADLESNLSVIPNVLASDTPIGDSDEDNVEVKKWGERKTFSFDPKDHVDIGENLKMLDFESAAKMTGARFVVYKSQLARLERALGNFMLDHQIEKGYEEIIPPYIVHERALYGTGQLPKFSEDLFKLEGTEWYLIPTSEVPLTNTRRDEIIDINELPVKMTAMTPCFRSEAGSHGRDTRGLIRQHQFNKVEMVNITHPDKSDETLNEMVASAEEILEKLCLPYRTVRLCTGDVGFGSIKTFDLEVWVPSQKAYREISSCSTCGDFQARRAKIRFKKEGEKPQFAHTLNGSGLAVGRCFVAVLENYQNEDGSITIPEVLRLYMGGLSKIELKK